MDLVWSLTLVYISTYLLLSANGRFEPGIIGLNGVKAYDWAPKGFVHDFKWNRKFCLFYEPLWVLDINLWHTNPREGHYPINEVAAKDIGKVYRAWRR